MASISRPSATYPRSSDRLGGISTIRSIHVWSSIGIFFSLLILYVFATWILTGEAKTTPTGVSPVPDVIRYNAIFWQSFLGLLSLILLHVLVIRPWIRERRLTLYGMLYIASQAMWWQDSLLNYFSPVFTYNSILVNWGSWNASVPGWLSNNAEKMPSPVLLYMGLYPVFFCGAVVVLVTLINKAKHRWPSVSNARMLTLMFVALGIFAVIAESAWLRAGLYTYTGVFSPVTFWADEPYKVPVTQLFFIDSLVLTTLAALVYFRDDRGLTIVERGVDELRVGSVVQTFLRLMAIVGAANVILFVFYNIPMNVLAVMGDGWAPSVLEKSYFTNGVCGDGSSYACPGGAVPIPMGPHALHIAPDGTLVIPPGTELPKRIVSVTQ